MGARWGVFSPRWHVIAWVAAVLPVGAGPAHAACLELLEPDALVFTGMLTTRVFPGPPHYADVRKGDAPEPAYILELEEEACARGDGTIPDGTAFRAVHLYSASDDTPVWSQLRRLVGRTVEVRGLAAFGAQSPHHHAPVVVSVASVAAATPPQAEPLQDGADARTTVEAFYAALAMGNGEDASRLVVPEKRERGPFSPGEITRFYGSLTEPLRPLAVSPVGEGRYRVRYTFVAGSARCNGDALVTTRRVDGMNLIAGIRALNGC